MWWAQSIRNQKPPPARTKASSPVNCLMLSKGHSPACPQAQGVFPSAKGRTVQKEKGIFMLLQGLCTGYSLSMEHSSSNYPYGWFSHPVQVFSQGSPSQWGQPWLPCLNWPQSTTLHPSVPDSLYYLLTLPALTFPHSTHHFQQSM